MNSALSLFSSIFKKTQKKDLSPIQAGKTQTWYGRVNFWTRSTSLLKKELDALVKNGCSGYMIELSSWARYSKKEWTSKWFKEVEKKYLWLVDQCRSRGLWIFVSIVNDNMGHGKYGDEGPMLSKVYDKALKLIDIVKAGGSSNVAVQPVAETQTSAGKKFEKACVKKLKGFVLVYNGDGGYPSKAPSGFQFYAVHPEKASKANPKNAIVVSDHGMLIRELNGGDLIAHADVAKTKKWKALNVKKGCPVVGYYAFKVKDFDKGAIEAMGMK